MKRFVWLVLVLTLCTPVFAEKKVSVQELKDILVSLNKENKNDEEIATRLKEIDLSEELTRSAVMNFAPYLPGPLSQEQMNALEGRSSILAPPRSDLPAAAAPDVTAQKAIFAKAIEYVTKTYMQNPHFIASKSTSRYQDGVEGIRTNSGVANNMPDSSSAHSWDVPNMFMRYLGTHVDQVDIDKGIERRPAEKAKVPWGVNGQVSEGGPGPILSIILQEAADGGKVNWLRWQTIHEKQIAVFSFAVDKKKSHYLVNYCCFPITQDTGRMGYEGTEANFQTGTDWKEFKATVPYRGEFFIDPDTGAIVRIVTQAGLKPTDFVHQEDMRIDYGPMVVDGKTYLLPMDSFTLTEVVPNGDNYAARYSVRHTLFSAAYQNYQMAQPGARGK